MILRLSRNKILGLKTEPVSRPGSGGKRILIIGDSTAVGTGASDPRDSIGGRLAHDFPDAEITNVANNGGLIRDLEKQITPLTDRTFDLIIISTGGNDVWHLTRLSKIQEELAKTLPVLKKMSTWKIFFLLYNNIGDAPLFPKIFRGFLTRRCNKVQNIIRSVAYASEIPTIELFNNEKDNPFITNPDGLFAPDGIHPSSDGYRMWYHRMWRLMTRQN